MEAETEDLSNDADKDADKDEAAASPCGVVTAVGDDVGPNGTGVGPAPSGGSRVGTTVPAAVVGVGCPPVGLVAV